MLEIKVTFSAPEVVDAINALASALRSKCPAKSASGQDAPRDQAAPPPLSATAPAPPAEPVPVAAVPVATAPTYDRDQIMTAGAALLDAGKINELMRLLNTFGVQAVTQLKQDQLGAFATELRKLGAQI